jgi:hypothetical protein
VLTICAAARLQTVGIMVVFFLLGLLSEALKSMPDCPWLAFAHAGSDHVVNRAEWDLFTGQACSQHARTPLVHHSFAAALVHLRLCVRPSDRGYSPFAARRVSQNMHNHSLCRMESCAMLGARYTGFDYYFGREPGCDFSWDELAKRYEKSAMLAAWPSLHLSPLSPYRSLLVPPQVQEELDACRVGGRGRRH